MTAGRIRMTRRGGKTDERSLMDIRWGAMWVEVSQEIAILRQTYVRWWQVPLWLPALVVAPLLGARAALHVRRKLIAARDEGYDRCTQCGYDLRATPDRSPECGWQAPPDPGVRVVTTLSRQRGPSCPPAVVRSFPARSCWSSCLHTLPRRLFPAAAEGLVEGDQVADQIAVAADQGVFGAEQRPLGVQQGDE